DAPAPLPARRARGEARERRLRDRARELRERAPLPGDRAGGAAAEAPPALLQAQGRPARDQPEPPPAPPPAPAAPGHLPERAPPRARGRPAAGPLADRARAQARRDRASRRRGRGLTRARAGRSFRHMPRERATACAVFSALALALFAPALLGGRLFFPAHTERLLPWRSQVAPERLAADRRRADLSLTAQLRRFEPP